MADYDPRWSDAIASIESGGQDNPYSTVTTSPNGRRALGKYQVMAENVSQWTKDATGTTLTPEQFLANPDVQDKVFQHRFSSYVDKYGNPQDAASAWFTGGPQSYGANKSDSLGTTGKGYVAKFNQFLKNGSTMPDGALSDSSTLGPGALQGQMMPPQTAVPGSGLENGLMGAAAALASISNPQQGAVLAGLRKNPTAQDYSFIQTPNGKLIRVNKNGTYQQLPGDYAKDTPSDDPFKKTSDELAAKASRDRITAVNDADTNADTGLAQINRARDVITNPNVWQGAGGDTVAKAKAIANAIGMDVKGVPESQIVDRVGTQMQLEQGKLLKGSISNYEDALMKKSSGVSLNNTKEANLDALAAREWLYNQQKAIAAHARDYAKANGGHLKDDWDAEAARFRDQYAKDHPFSGATASAAPIAPGTRPPLSSFNR